MNTTKIKGIGTINIDSLEMVEGQLEIRMPVEAVSKELSKTIDRLFDSFRKQHPKVENVYYESRIVFSFGSLNPEFSLMIIVFDGDNQDTAEIWDGLEVTLSEDVRKRLRSIAWNKLGEMLFSL